jgi:HlyD family secretion protein
MLGLVVGAVAASCARWVLGLALGTLGASTAAWAISDDTSRATPAEPAAATRIAAPGRVEGATETIEVASAVDGVVARVFVHEGDLVAVGQPIAEIDCRELEFEVRSLTASRDARLADRVRLLEGGRPDERAMADASLDAALAAARKADADLQRARDLWSEGLISRQEYDTAVAAQAAREAGVRAARERVSVAARLPLDSEVREVDARLVQANADVDAARSRRSRCTVTSPIAGTVLRLHKQQGEGVSVAGEPVASVADTSTLRVRAEVDEADLGRIHVGTAAVVGLPAFDGLAMEAKVVEVAARMGRKSIRSGDPADKSDRDVLEVLLSIVSAGTPLPIGARVTVVFL